MSDEEDTKAARKPNGSAQDYHMAMLRVGNSMLKLLEMQRTNEEARKDDHRAIRFVITEIRNAIAEIRNQLGMVDKDLAIASSKIEDIRENTGKHDLANLRLDPEDRAVLEIAKWTGKTVRSHWKWIAWALSTAAIGVLGWLSSFIHRR